MPLAALAGAVVALTLFCRQLLTTATAGGAVAGGTLPLYVAAGCFLLAAATVVVLQSLRMAQCVAGPEHRLIESLRRIRAGDLTFRVHLHKGDLLTGLADECNAVLEWLNANPPAGARTGTDVFEVAAIDGEQAEARP